MKRLFLLIICCAVVGYMAAEQVIRSAQTNTTYGHVNMAVNGDNCSLTPVAETGYEFVAWEDGTSTSPRVIPTSEVAASKAASTPMYAVFARSEDVNHEDGNVVVSLIDGATGAMSLTVEECGSYSPFTAWNTGNREATIAYTETDGTRTPIFKAWDKTLTPHATGTIAISKVHCGYELTATGIGDYDFLRWTDDETAPATRTVTLAAGTYSAEFTNEITINDQGLPAIFASRVTSGKSTVVNLQRNLSSASFNTLSLPFDATTVELGLSEAYEMTSATLDGDKLDVNFETAVTTLQAGHPYLVKPATDITEDIHLSDKVLSNAFTPTETSCLDFIPIFEPTELDASDSNVLFLGAKDVLYRPSRTGNMNGLRAYFRIKSGSPVQMRLSFGKGATTNISNLSAASNCRKYIIDGRMLIDVDGITYNSLGQRTSR